MNVDRSRQKISIEDLLRVKRAERPPAEFWVRFERELRAKQLAAIMEKHAWWHAFPRAFARVSRLHLPLGATAVLAVTVLTIREYRVSSMDRDLANIASAPVTGLNARAETTAPAESVPAPMVAVPPSTMEQQAQSVSPAEEPAVSTVSTGEIAQMINGLGASSQPDDAQRTSNPASRFIIAAALEKAQAADTETEILAPRGNFHGFEDRVLPARMPMTEPLAQLATPQFARVRARYLTTVLSTSYAPEPAAVSSRRLDRIRESQLHPDESSRIETRNGSLSIKLW
ncbi:MAG: hypothetical protein EXS39_05530 [Opitutaceae bacterium]|nr:hypothetical protein [Opitutaceae bacterium]